MAGHVCFFVAVFLVSLEVLVRLFVPRSDFFRMIRESADPVLSYELVPGSSVSYSGAMKSVGRTTTISINSMGFRDREVGATAPPGVTRILAVGDSFTIGLGVEGHEAWPKVLERRLNEARPGSFEVLNLGVPGYNLRQVVRHLQRHLDLRPDLVIYLFASNDIERALAFPHGPWQAPFRVSRALAAIVAGANWIRTEAVPVRRVQHDRQLRSAEPALAELARVTGERGVPVVVVGYYYGRGAGQIATWVAARCRQHGLTYLNLPAELYGPRWRDLRLGDGHFNVRGNELIADAIVGRLPLERAALEEVVDGGQLGLVHRGDLKAREEVQWVDVLPVPAARHRHANVVPALVRGRQLDANSGFPADVEGLPGQHHDAVVGDVDQVAQQLPGVDSEDLQVVDERPPLLAALGYPVHTASARLLSVSSAQL